MIDIETLTREVLDGKAITKSEAVELYALPLEPLCRNADEIRRRFCSNSFDLCTIINGKKRKMFRKLPVLRAIFISSHRRRRIPSSFRRHDRGPGQRKRRAGHNALFYRHFRETAFGSRGRLNERCDPENPTRDEHLSLRVVRPFERRTVP